uniref:Gustatory receptor GR60 n=1 Tax=Lobesia botrana TaxID=209534 RepID=A0A345BEZ8_9NEOP|nr:gustatory receptor GR60 [Lobesia botrana]
MILFYFDVNVIVATRVVKFLEYEVTLWKGELVRFQDTCSETNHVQLVKYLVEVGTEEKRLMKAYVDIIRAFKLCSSIFGMSILVLMVEAFAHPLIYVQFFIDICKGAEGTQFQFVSRLVFLVSLVWIVKTFTLLSWLCVECQKFCLAVVDVEKTSAIILSKDRCLVPAHRLSKNVL